MLFVWSKSRVVPVRVTEFSVTEEAFDPSLNPIRAKVSLGLRVLTTDDLGFTHKGGTIFMSYLRVARGAGRQGRRRASLAVARPHQPALTEERHDDRSRPSPDRCRRHPDQPVRAEQPLLRRRRSGSTSTRRRRSRHRLRAAPLHSAAARHRGAARAHRAERRAARPAGRAGPSATPSSTGASPTPTR